MAVFAEKHYPEVLSAPALDHYLASGWYRMGQSIFTTHFLCFSQQLYSAIWIRLDMQEHQHNKRQRKLMRRNAARFRIVYAPFKITAEKEALYQRYRANFSGFIASSLQESLLDGDFNNIYRTIEAQIYDGDQLVGISFFDQGADTLASILGIYDPDYERHSLGYYSMLLEMEYCQQNAIRYYYPGYIVPGYERFDYKLRIGEVEYLQLATGNWDSFTEMPPTDTPLALMRSKLEELNRELTKLGVANKVYWYPLFEANLFGLLQGAYLDFPVILSLGTFDAEAAYYYWVVYDIRDGYFKLLECMSNDDFRFYFQEGYLKDFDPEHFLLALVLVQRLLANTADAKELAKLIGKHRDQLS